ncbi:MAG: hypothetical protein N2489_06870 [Clostridia bacterium]|nr:hypothetical protein [Clostridia bacterium]
MGKTQMKKSNELSFEAQEQNNMSRSRTRVRLGGALIAAFLLIYVPSLYYWIYGQQIRTEILRIGTIEQAYNTDACLIREEEVISAPFDGRFIPDVNEGERVPANFRIATVIKGNSEDLLNRMKELDLRIIKAQKEKYANEEFFSEDIVKLDNEIFNKVRLLADESEKNSLNSLGKIKEGLDGLVQKKAAIIGSSSTPDIFIKNLKKEKEQLNEKIRSSTKEIVSGIAGIVSYKVDGYEASLNPSAIKEMTPSALSGIKQAEGEGSLKAGGAVGGKPFVKIIRDVECYVAAALDTQKSKLFMIDDSVAIRFNDIGRVVDGTVEYKSNEQDGKVIIAVKIDKAVSETAHMRKTNIDLIKSSYKGLKVPVSCLREINIEEKKAKIILDKANYASERTVRITGMNEEFAIIESLSPKANENVSLYDIYVVDPKNIQEGQVINQ